MSRSVLDRFLMEGEEPKTGPDSRPTGSPRARDRANQFLARVFNMAPCGPTNHRYQPGSSNYNLMLVGRLGTCSSLDAFSLGRKSKFGAGLSFYPLRAYIKYR